MCWPWLLLVLIILLGVIIWFVVTYSGNNKVEKINILSSDSSIDSSIDSSSDSSIDSSNNATNNATNNNTNPDQDHQPVDLVVTWVCPDPTNDTLRNSYTGDPKASNNSRTKSQEELLCLFRSIDMFAPWIRRIYVISVTGYPGWLNVNNPRVVIVSHSDIFKDTTNLPTFNSIAIESQIHHIPGLAERYIYCNDDMWFGTPVHREDFFDSEGRAKVYKGEKLPNIKLINTYIKNRKYYTVSWLNLQKLQKLDGVSIKHRTKHQATAHLKSVVEAAERKYSNVYREQASIRLRSADRVNMNGLAAYYGISVGKYVFSPGISEIFICWNKSRSQRKKLKDVLKRRPKLLCINNISEVDNDLWQRFWREYYPKKSSFEL